MMACSHFSISLVTCDTVMTLVRPASENTYVLQSSKLTNDPSNLVGLGSGLYDSLCPV